MSGAGRERYHSAAAVLLCGLFLVLLAYPIQRRFIGGFWTEADFYAWYAPDADRIASNRLPENPYNPPGYPLTLALLSRVTGDHFTSGKWLAAITGSLAGLLTFHLFRRLFGAGPALLAIPFVFLSGSFGAYAVQATTDVPFLAVCLAAMLVMTGERPSDPIRMVLAGILCGVAFLIRYNGVFLLVPGLLAAVWTTGRPGRRLMLAGLFLLSAAATASPWLGFSWLHHGTLIHSANHRDMAIALFGSDRDVTSFVDLIAADPRRFARRYAIRVAQTFGKSLGKSLGLLPSGPLAVLGIALSLARRRSRPVVLVLTSGLSYLLLMSLTHWETRYFFLVLVVYAGFAAFAIFALAAWVGRVTGSPLAAGAASAALALFIIVPSVDRAVTRVRRTIERQPVEVLPAARFVRDATPPGAIVMAQKPHIAYLSGRTWTRLLESTSVEHLRLRLEGQQPDFLVYDSIGRRLNPRLAALTDPGSAIPWLTPIYHDPAGGVVIYAVDLSRR